jgi:peptidoglycan/LPS O-acetylase OafA/YrhL
LLKAGEAFELKSSADFSRNNLDCLRLILASIVALFHLHFLSNISTFECFGTYLSPSFAVRSFFVISGLLIYRSYTRSSSVKSYFEKRIRRIYPAYFTIIVVVAFALFPLSAAPASRYFSFGLVRYLAANLVFLNFLAPRLPGLFVHSASSAVNGALWTLKIEVVFYLFIPVLHWLCERLGTKRVLWTLFILSCVWKYGFQILWSMDSLPIHSRILYGELAVQFPGQLAYFIAGIFLLLYFDKLKHYFGVILAITVTLFLVDHFYTGKIFASYTGKVFDSDTMLDLIWISGVVFIFGFWRYFGNFSKHGDFSYGVYIVHWPILQTLVALHLNTRLNPWVFLALAVSLIFLAAFLMWHLVEKRFLASSSHYRVGDSGPAPRVSSHEEPRALRASD